MSVHTLTLRRFYQQKYFEFGIYTNLLMISCIFLLDNLMGIRGALTYAFAGFVILLISLVLRGLTGRRATTRAPIFIGISILLNELVLISVPVINTFNDPIADAPTAELIAIFSAFLTVPIVSRVLGLFILTKVLLFASCVYGNFALAHTIGTFTGQNTDYIALTFILVLLNLIIGYWAHRNHTSQVSQSLSVARLEASARAQNLRLRSLIDEVESQKDEIERNYALSKTLFNFLGHDLRQPINALSFMLFDLEDKEKDRWKKQKLLAARDSVNSANRMIERVMHLSVERSADSPPTQEKVKLSDVFHQLQQEYGDAFRRSNGELETTITHIVLITDRELLLRALRNLLSNASKYAGGVRTSLQVTEQKSSYEIHVADEGPGLSKQDVKTILNPYIRARSSDGVSGFGLGLAITETIAKTLGGSLRVESTLGSGATFTLAIPKANQRAN